MHKERKLTELAKLPRNPRHIKSDDFEKLCTSIKSNPDYFKARPLILSDRTGELIIIAGNQRYEAALKLGLKKVPTYLIKDLTEEREREIIIRDNVSNGSWDTELLANEWDIEQLEDWGLNLDFPEDETILEAEEDDFEWGDVGGVKTDIVIGDLIEIGEHRLLCGDSTKAEDIEKLMEGEKADLAHNDPPYGMKKEKEGVENDNLNYSDLLDFNREWIPLQFSHLKDNGSWYCWGVDEPLMDIYSGILKSYIKDNKMTFRNLITWDKGHGQGQNSDLTRSYATADEKCLFVVNGLIGSKVNGCDYNGEYDSVLKYLQSEEASSGLSRKEMKAILGENMYSHYMTKSQFTLLPESHYNSLSMKTGRFAKPYNELKQEFIKCKYNIKNTQFYFNNTHDNMNNVWHFPRHIKDGQEGGHATPKPIPLCERVIKSSCPDSGLIIDFFLGSGSTMVAAHNLKRKCYGIELSPFYCQVIINRMLNLDPKLTVKINGEKNEPRDIIKEESGF